MLETFDCDINTFKTEVRKHIEVAKEVPMSSAETRSVLFTDFNQRKTESDWLQKMNILMRENYKVIYIYIFFCKSTAMWELQSHAKDRCKNHFTFYCMY